VSAGGPPFEASNPGFEALVRESFARQGLMGHLGARLTRVAPGEVEIVLPFSRGVSQQHGYFHAGAIGAVADSAAGYAGVTLMPAGSAALSVEYKLNLLAPADGDEIRAVGRVVRRGRTLSVCVTEVFTRRAGGAEVQCALLQQTLMCLPEREGRPAG
jgi:uncharacterized protein (TIGR00369 family)